MNGNDERDVRQNVPSTPTSRHHTTDPNAMVPNASDIDALDSRALRDMSRQLERAARSCGPLGSTAATDDLRYAAARVRIALRRRQATDAVAEVSDLVRRVAG